MDVIFEDFPDATAFSLESGGGLPILLDIYVNLLIDCVINGVDMLPSFLNWSLRLVSHR
jgi:hypothetical protein